MSLDTLYEKILQSEQQLTEQTQQLKEVKIAIIRYNERIKSATEKHKNTCEELDRKAQQLSAMRLQLDLMRKCEDQMLKQIEELLCQKSRLRGRLAKIKWESKEEEKNFLQEISRFNEDFSLGSNRDVVLESQAHTEILDLDRELDSLKREMDVMRCRNSHMSSTQEENRALRFNLQHLDGIQRELDQQLREAEATSESLRAHSLSVSQKPLTDSTCLRLRKELEMHREGELELLREALSSEILFLQSKLGGSQKEQ